MQAFRSSLLFGKSISPLLLLILVGMLPATAQAGLRAGAAAVDITPEHYPVRVNGMFNERSADAAVDTLHARAMALDDGTTRLVLCIVDTCMMEQYLIDDAKSTASAATGIPTSCMMVSATHTHSAPSAMGCLGSRQDPAYAAWLPGKIAEALVGAVEHLQPAQVGWASVDDWAHTHNRRWIRRADKIFADPFGDLTVRAHMHPGYESVDVIGPSGPVDPGLSILAARTPDGTPIALLANYSQHYYGSPLLSADYYGAFARAMGIRLGQTSSEGPFVAMMSQGTSGDLMWMDYGSPKKDGNFEMYADEVATRAMAAYDSIVWQDTVPLAMTEASLTLKYRVPNEERLAWAKARLEALGDEIPKSQSDIYAAEALILHERQETELKLQAIRVGDLTMATLPDEVYAITGLKLKLQAPLGTHFNIELANGSVGYIPPPEQHELGGYTTWPARTAGLEVQAEPTIVETLLGALEKVSETPRKAITDTDGPYLNAVMAFEPLAHWRMNEIAGRTLHSATGADITATLSGGAALFLPGVGSGTGSGVGEALTSSNFGGPNDINRAVHFVADGKMTTNLNVPTGPFAITFWFWFGEVSGVSARQGDLLTLPTGEKIHYAMAPSGPTEISLVTSAQQVTGPTKLSAGDWHFAVLNVGSETVALSIDGDTAAACTADRNKTTTAAALVFGDTLEGKLDEISVFAQPITPESVASLWQHSGIAGKRAEEQAARDGAEKDAIARAKAPQFPPSLEKSIAELRPARQAALDKHDPSLIVEGGTQLAPGRYAAFASGRIHGTLDNAVQDYSVSLWFKNTINTHSRPVTGYLFSIGTAAGTAASGDHFGIGGNFRNDFPGRLILFNGDAKNEVLVGTTAIPPNTWNHVLLVREGNHLRVWLNGVATPEIDGDIETTVTDSPDFFLGARSDNFAPLAGYLAEFALFDRALSPEEALAIHGASGQPVGTATVEPPMEPAKLSAPPLSTNDGLAAIQVPAGYTVDLVASEPDLLDPVAFDWDTSGRLWVVEMADYPLGLDGNGASGGRVRMLTDTDQNGTYEQGQIFAEGLNFPTGILTWRNGVIVTAAPDILYLEDTTGNGRADVQEVLLTGLSEGNQQLRANGLRWGLDNWVYVAAGGHHGKYAIDTRLHSTRAGTETVIGSRDFRFNPDTGVVEPQSGPTQFGRNRDDWGHWFGTQNARPLWHYTLPDHYLSRNPFLAAPDGQIQVLGEVGPPVFPASALQKRFHDFKASGRFTSACSGMIYRDTLLFSDDSMNGFTCEPFHNLVQRINLVPDGVTFSGTRSGPPEGPDFFASTDRWCRPVMVRTGPDGGLWIADMYRYMIEHPQWLPEEGKAELLPFYREGDDRGRIYRVRPAGATLHPTPNLESMGNEALVAQLGASNGWIRDKAQQLLLWRDARDVTPALEALAAHGELAQGRLHALCTLDGLGSLSPDLVARALADPNPGVRENALRLAETHGTEEVVAAALRLTEDPEAKVRQQLAFTLGAFTPTKELGKTLADLLLRDHDDPFITAAALSSALPHQENLIAELVTRDDPAIPPLRLTLADMALSEGNKESVATLILPAFEKASEQLTQVRADACADAMDFLKRRDTSIAALAEGTASEPALELQAIAIHLQNVAKYAIANEEVVREVRLAAATLLAGNPALEESAVTWLAGLLSTQTPPDDLRQALVTLARTSDDRVPSFIIDAWATFTPDAREQAADVLLSRSTWTRALLEAIGKRSIRPTDLSPVRRTRLLNLSDEALRTLAVAQLASDANPERAEVIAAYKPALTLAGDVARGQVKYVEACATCHKVGDTGFEIGPDLRTVAQHPKEKILANILDPNIDIQPGYHAYNCELEDGEQLFGLIVSENATSIIMKLPGAKLRKILRSDIFALESTTISMMPDGWEAALNYQDMADLIAFLQSLH